MNLDGHDEKIDVKQTEEFDEDHTEEDLEFKQFEISESSAEKKLQLQEPVWLGLAAKKPSWGRGIKIAVIGPIGAGKTTLSEHLAEHLGLELSRENVTDTEYLQDFYQDPKANGFVLQVELFVERAQRQLNNSFSTDILLRGSIQDRSMMEDGIFAKMLYKDKLMSAKQYRTYKTLVKTFSPFLPLPNFLIFLDVSPETCLKRIAKRGREMEKIVTLEYLKKLHAGYVRFVKKISRTIPVIQIPWEEFGDVEEVSRLCEQAWLNMSMITTIHPMSSSTESVERRVPRLESE